MLVRPIGGTVNMLLVLAGLILTGSRDRGDRAHADARGRRVGAPGARAARTLWATACGESAASPYLRLIAALVFLAAITTQWTASS